jgi:purine-binding chemotaxis protein CheW
MAGRRPRAPEGAPEPALRLPSSGLAEEILASLAAGGAGPEEPPEEPLEEPLEGPGRVLALVDRLTRRAAAAEAAAPEEPEVWVTFEVAGEVYGLPVLCVEEVLRVTVITRLPYAPAPVRGITQLRGRVLPVVDLRVRLGQPATVVGPASRIVVVTARGRTLGLLVDGARQVVKLLPSALEAPPPEVMSERSGFITAVCRREGALIILLDVDEVLLVPESLDAEAG